MINWLILFTLLILIDIFMKKDLIALSLGDGPLGIKNIQKEFKWTFYFAKLQSAFGSYEL